MMKLLATRTKTLSRLALRRRYAFDLPLAAALLVGLVLRLLLWGNIPRTGLISDEGEYLSAASWLAHGHGFDWYQGYLWTRAPLYPLFIAAHLRLFGDSLAPIYATQTLLSLVNVALIYLLARHLTDDRRPTTQDKETRRQGDHGQQPAESQHATRNTQQVSQFSILNSQFSILRPRSGCAADGALLSFRDLLTGAALGDAVHHAVARRVFGVGALGDR